MSDEYAMNTHRPLAYIATSQRAHRRILQSRRAFGYHPPRPIWNSLRGPEGSGLRRVPKSSGVRLEATKYPGGDRNRTLNDNRKQNEDHRRHTGSPSPPLLHRRFYLILPKSNGCPVFRKLDKHRLRELDVIRIAEFRIFLSDKAREVLNCD